MPSHHLFSSFFLLSQGLSQAALIHPHHTTLSLVASSCPMEQTQAQTRALLAHSRPLTSVTLQVGADPLVYSKHSC